MEKTEFKANAESVHVMTLLKVDCLAIPIERLLQKGRRWALAAASIMALPICAQGAVSGILGGQTMNGQAIPCDAKKDGIRLCTGDMSGIGGADLRFKSFDGSPITVFVSLPSSPSSGSDGNYPLIVQNHGWGAPPSGPDDTQYGTATAVNLAKDGYVVVQFQARGWGNSCGNVQSRLVNPVACLKGYVHMDDYRFEIRDVQYIVGLLVDSGLVDPNRVAAVGESYGAGASLALATLNNRIMNQDGSLSPWVSPKGTPLHIAAAVPLAGWSDLAYSMAPNGRTFDSKTAKIADIKAPIGVQKLSITTGLFAEGFVGGAYYSLPGTDPEADQTTWSTVLSAGEPYDSPQIQEAVRQYTQYRSPYYLLAGAYGFKQTMPAPLLMDQGFTDDVFPADEVLRYYNLHRALYPTAPISLTFFDGGHQRGNNKAIDKDFSRVFANRVQAFLDYYLKGKGAKPASDVVAFAQTCPADVKSLGPYSAPTWAALHPGEVVFKSEPAQTILSIGGDITVSAAFDPVAGGLACTTATGAAEGPGVANYSLPTPTGQGYTLLGAPTITADLNVTGLYAYIAARLVDVDPVSNTKILVARGLYRIDPKSPNGRQTFQLHANGWHFAPGHIPRLELLGKDAPYSRPSNGIFTISVSNLQLRLPVHEVPGTTGTPPEVVASTDDDAIPTTTNSGGALDWLTLLPLLSAVLHRRYRRRRAEAA